MITLSGKTQIKRYLAQQVGDIARAIAIGIGDVAESNTHTALQFEIARSSITLVSYDYANNKLIFKASIPQDVACKLYEVGLFSQAQNKPAGDYTSRLLTTFDSNTEVWSAGTYASTNTRIGVDSLRIAPGTSATITATKSDVSIDLSGNSAADTFILAFYNLNANASQIRFRLKTDGSNYYTYSAGSPGTTGYRILTFTKGSATVTGTPSWSNITMLEVEVVSGAGGASQVDFDGLRIEDIDTLNPEYVMVSRELLSTPVTKVAGAVQDIEFSLPVTV